MRALAKVWAVGVLSIGAGSAVADPDRDSRAVPPGHLPPPGECRVWYPDRPPGQQPPPTDCRSARREARHTGGEVIYGDREDRYDRGGDDRYDHRASRNERCEDSEDCEYRERYARSRLPDMAWALADARDEHALELRRWFGESRPRARLFDADDDGKPEAIEWYDEQEQKLERWVDDDGDGRADQVVIFSDGRPIRVVREGDEIPRG